MRSLILISRGWAFAKACCFEWSALCGMEPCGTVCREFVWIWLEGTRLDWARGYRLVWFGMDWTITGIYVLHMYMTARI